MAPQEPFRLPKMMKELDAISLLAEVQSQIEQLVQMETESQFDEVLAVLKMLKADVVDLRNLRREFVAMRDDWEEWTAVRRQVMKLKDDVDAMKLVKREVLELKDEVERLPKVLEEVHKLDDKIKETEYAICSVRTTTAKIEADFMCIPDKTAIRRQRQQMERSILQLQVDIEQLKTDDSSIVAIEELRAEMEADSKVLKTELAQLYAAIEAIAGIPEAAELVAPAMMSQDFTPPKDCTIDTESPSSST